MACTCLGETYGSKRCYEINDPEVCAQHSINCTFQQGSCTDCTTTPFVTYQLITPFPDEAGMTGVYLDTMDTLFDIRDLLAGSQIGERLLDFNRQFTDHAARILVERPDLTDQIVAVLMRAATFGRAMVMDVATAGRTESQHVFTAENLAYAERIAEDLDRTLGDSEVSAAIAEVCDLARSLVGLTPAEVTHRLGLGEPRHQEAR